MMVEDKIKKEPIHEKQPSVDIGKQSPQPPLPRYTIEVFLSKILKCCFEEVSDGTELPPSIFNEDCMKPTVSAYNSYQDYFKSHELFLLLSVWDKVFGYKSHLNI